VRCGAVCCVMLRCACKSNTEMSKWGAEQSKKYRIVSYRNNSIRQSCCAVLGCAEVRVALCLLLLLLGSLTVDNGVNRRHSKRADGALRIFRVVLGGVVRAACEQSYGGSKHAHYITTKKSFCILYSKSFPGFENDSGHQAFLYGKPCGYTGTR
jgi:hypothetical protein